MTTPVLALSEGTLAAIIVIVIVDLFAIVFGLSFVRSRREQRAAEEAATAAALGQPAPKAPKPVSRREFFRRSLIASVLLYGAQFGAATIAFLWPSLKGGFGSVINVGKVEDIKGAIQDEQEPFYSGTGRFYIVSYNGRPSDEVDYETEGLAAQGIMPLYQRCVHLGCRVPFCEQSQWFECPCHGSKYNSAGEYKLGPAPRGMDRFRIEISSSRRRPGRHVRGHPRAAARAPTRCAVRRPGRSAWRRVIGMPDASRSSRRRASSSRSAGAIFLAIALGVLLARGRTRRQGPDIPSGMRPGPSDADLETPLLQKLQGWGVVLVVFFVVWVPVTLALRARPRT